MSAIKYDQRMCRLWNVSNRDGIAVISVHFKIAFTNVERFDSGRVCACACACMCAYRERFCCCIV